MKQELVVRKLGSTTYGETLEELKWSFEKMKEAFDQEVLDLDNIVYAKPY